MSDLLCQAREISQNLLKRTSSLRITILVLPLKKGESEIVCVFRGGGRGVNCSFRGMPGVKL